MINGSLPKICILVDVRGWAFENIAIRIAEKLKAHCQVDIVYTEDFSKGSDLFIHIFDGPVSYDLVHFFWRDIFLRLFGSRQILNALKGKTEREKDTFFRRIATTKKTTWICDHLFLDNTPDSVLRRWVLHYTDGYAVSSHILNQIYMDISSVRNPARVITDGVDLGFFKKPGVDKGPDKDRVIRIGWAGNSSWGDEDVDHKGLSTIIAPAVQRLKSEGLSVEGVFCDRVKKWIPRKAMPAYYASIDIYVCASLSEGTPNPVLEAMACGLPVLSTDVGIVREVFGPKQQQFIVSDRQSNKFLDQLRKMVVNDELRKQLSNENIKSIQDWGWNERINSWHLFFEDILAREHDPVIERRQLVTLKEFDRLSRLGAYGKPHPENSLNDNRLSPL